MIRPIFFKLALLITLFAFPFGEAKAASATEALRYLPVQDAGRTKPFDTFARETLQLIYGAENYKTPSGEKRPAIEIVMTWMLVPQYWDNQKFVQISQMNVKESLKLPLDQKYFSPVELMNNPRLSLVIQEWRSYQETKQKPTPYFQGIQRLESQLAMFQAVKQGQVIRVVPPAPTAAVTDPAAAQAMPAEPEKWLSIAELQGDLQNSFSLIIRSLIQALPKDAPAADQAANSQAAQESTISLQQAVENFKTAARAQNPSLYPSDRDISIEVHDRTLHPFMVTWILYLIGALVLGVAWQTGSRRWYQAGWIVSILAILMHTYGFSLRMYIMGRPPVSNMYESVVWVSWGAIVFAMVFEALYRRRFILLAGSVVGVLCLVVADFAPTILDRRMDPLEPVLRSNMWLTIHVMTITISYSAFFLAWALGNIGLGFIMRGDKPTAERVRVLVQSIYRSIQVGVVLLAAGIILGGIWADYSWGRFWGWDPKETWALIALLGYLAVLHGRLVGWVQNVGMMVWSIIAFNLVIMAWYGVNFVLGAGLHSYGFGAGGVQYVSGFVILNLIYVGYALYIQRARSTPSKN